MKLPLVLWAARPTHARCLVAVMVVCIAAILSVSYHAAREWTRAATALAEHRAEATVNLLVTALAQDMRAVQVTVLSDQQADVTEMTAANRYTLIASAFARYPYPGVFFMWSAAQPGDPLFFVRADRPPPWLTLRNTSPLLPVETTTAPAVGRRLIRRISADAGHGRRYSTFDMALGDSRWQIVALLSYADPYQLRLKGVFGFLVDLAWAREHYFGNVARQVLPIDSGTDQMRLAVRDRSGDTVFGRRADGGATAGDREFPLLFFDPRLVAIEWPADLGREVWAAHASIEADPVILAANAGAFSTLVVAALLAIAIVLAVWFILRAARAGTELANTRTEFMATVTHELKTPLATIQAISETFASGCGMTPELWRKYGRFGIHEAKRLRRLIDNLLAYSRVTDIGDVYAFEAVAPSELVATTLRDFASQLEYAGFDVRVDVPATLPRIRADRRAISLALANLVDNAIRYSDINKYVGVSACNGGGAVVVTVTDRGIGIPKEEIPLITRRFFTGRLGSRGGSGLGLAIVDRIAADHRGSLSILSTVGEGTTARLALPIA